MFGKIGNFIEETKQELKKVTWPTKREVWESTGIVITTTFIMALFVGLIDLLLSWAMRFLFG